MFGRSIVVKDDWLLLEVWLSITIMNMIGNWEFSYLHMDSHGSPDPH